MPSYIYKISVPALPSHGTHKCSSQTLAPTLCTLQLRGGRGVGECLFAAEECEAHLVHSPQLSQRKCGFWWYSRLHYGPVLLAGGQREKNILKKCPIQLNLEYLNDIRKATAKISNSKFSLSRLPGAVSTPLSTWHPSWRVTRFRGSVLCFRNTVK